MSFFGFSATFGGKILWKSIMEDTYIKEIHTSKVGGAKLLNLGKKCHFWLFLSPETQSYTILATFNGQTLCKLIVIGTYIKKSDWGAKLRNFGPFWPFLLLFWSNQIFLAIFFLKINLQMHPPHLRHCVTFNLLGGHILLVSNKLKIVPKTTKLGVKVNLS